MFLSSNLSGSTYPLLLSLGAKLTAVGSDPPLERAAQIFNFFKSKKIGDLIENLIEIKFESLEIFKRRGCGVKYMQKHQVLV